MTGYYKTIKQTRIWGKGRPAVICFQRKYEEVFNDYAERNYRTVEATEIYRIRVAHQYKRYSDNTDAFDSETLTKDIFEDIMRRASKGKEGVTYESLLNELSEKNLIARTW